MNSKLLSICIPTFNRADKLKLSLLILLRQVVKSQDQVEIIVSDNASTDNTEEVLVKLKKEYPFLKTFRNDINIGFNRNFFKLSDEYAQGKYFWLIGDDDVIDSSAIEIVLKIINENANVPFIGLNFRILSIEDIVNLSQDKSNYSFNRVSMSHMLSMQCRAENLLATFISCNIILLDRLKNYDKSVFSNFSWDNFMSLFPHTHMITETIRSNDSVIYIKEPLVSVIIHEKEWDDRLALINLYYILDVYKFYISCGYKKSDIRRVKKRIIYYGFGAMFFSKAQFRYKLNFFKFSIFDLYLYKLIILKILGKIKKMIKN